MRDLIGDIIGALSLAVIIYVGLFLPYLLT